MTSLTGAEISDNCRLWAPTSTYLCYRCLYLIYL